MSSYSWPPLGSNPAVGTNGSPIPPASDLAGAENPSGNLQPLMVDAAGNLLVNVNAGTLTVLNPSILPTGGPVPADATYIGANIGGNLTGLTATVNGLKVDGSAVTQPISAASLPLPTGAATNAELITINTTLGSPLQAGGSVSVSNFPATQPVSGSVSVSNFPATTTVVQPTAANLNATVTGTVAATQSGTWDVRNVTGTVSLPTGAATSANQTSVIGSATGGTAATNSLLGGTVYLTTPPTLTNGQQSSLLSDSDGSLRVNVVDSLPSGTNNIGKVQTISPLNSAGSGSAAAATVSTVITLTAPANAVGAFLMNIDTSTANIRWAVGRTATTTLGQQLQPGRDAWIPTSANISLVAESGTQTYDVQWITQ